MKLIIKNVMKYGNHTIYNEFIFNIKFNSISKN